MVLPELGGRVQLAYDKIRKRPFAYYNQVIKPALVGLTGPWISGGIEFNFPQHHRPSIFLPLDCSPEENPDGSKTVWCSEMLRTSTQQIAEENERSIVDIGTLRKANEDLFATINSVLNIQEEGRRKRIAAEQELQQAEDELKRKLVF
jgi:hypothetical protein